MLFYKNPCNIVFSISFIFLIFAININSADALLRHCGGDCFCDASNCCSCPTGEYGYLCVDYDACTPGSGGGEPLIVPDIQLRADVNRDGFVSSGNFTQNDPDELDETKWSDQRGAIILPNIDYDNGIINNLSKNDASDNIINNQQDLEDLAVLRVLPWAVHPDQNQRAYATLTYRDDLVNVFVKRSGGEMGYQLWNPSFDTLTGDELLSGMEFRVEAVDIAKDTDSTYIDFRVDAVYKIDDSYEKNKSDVVRVRIAPLIFHHHLDKPEKVVISPLSARNDNYLPFEQDMKVAAATANIELHQYTDTFPKFGVGQWIQDRFEAGYVSMPKTGGGQQSIRVHLYNGTYESEAKNLANLQADKDVAALPYFYKTHGNLDMGGNFETIPPTRQFPFGRILRGTRSRADQTLTQILKAQSLQPELEEDVFTDWLTVGHIDEVISFIPMNNSRGWAVLVSDPDLAKRLILKTQNEGNGGSTLLTGIKYDNKLKEITIDNYIASDLWKQNESSIEWVEKVIDSLKSQVGLSENDFVRLPVLFYGTNPNFEAFTADVTNGALLREDYFASPKPYGPVVNGKDLFVEYVEKELTQKRDINIKWIEDFLSYHVLLGEVHCGSNVVRKIPQDPWWKTLSSRGAGSIKGILKGKKINSKKIKPAKPKKVKAVKAKKQKAKKRANKRSK